MSLCIIAIENISQTQLTLVNGTLHCYVFRLLSNHHQVVDTKHLKHTSSSCFATHFPEISLIFTYLLTPWSRIPLEKLTGFCS